MDSMPEASSPVAYVFGYGSLIALREPLLVAGQSYPAVNGRLLGFRRFWGAAMNNWEAVNDAKHFRDRGTGERPRIRVAYLDIREVEGGAVNGVAVPVDPARLEAFDAREVNYTRLDISTSFEPAIPQPVFVYLGTEEARDRCRKGIADRNIFVSRDYVELVRDGFDALGPEAVTAFEGNSDALLFPERDLDLVQPGLGGGEGGDWGSADSSRSI
jgi:cation transport regulator ChaC